MKTSGQDFLDQARPRRVAIGDFLDKPLDRGGLALGRPLASLALAHAALIWLLPQRAGAMRTE